MVRALSILLHNDLSHSPISHGIPILFTMCIIGAVIFNCGRKVKKQPQPASNMTYYGSSGGGGIGNMAAGVGVGLAAGLAVDAVVDTAVKNDSGGGGGGCGGGGCGGGCGS